MTSEIMPRDEAEQLQRDSTFYEGEVSKEDGSRQGQALYMFRNHALQQFVFGRGDLDAMWSNVSNFLSRELPEDDVFWTSNHAGDSVANFMYMYGYRVDLRLPSNIEGVNEQFKSVYRMSDDEIKTARLIPSMESAKVSYLRSMWSQHYPLTERTDHVVAAEPILSSAVMQKDGSSVSLEDSYVIGDVIRSFFTQEVWNGDMVRTEKTYMDAKLNYKHIALRKMFRLMQVTDVWPRMNMNLHEKEAYFKSILSTANIDNSEETFKFFGIVRVCCVVILYRLLVLIDDAIVNMYMKVPDGPYHIMYLQSLLKENDVKEPPLKLEVERLKHEIENLRLENERLSNERESRRKLPREQ